MESFGGKSTRENVQEAMNRQWAKLCKDEFIELCTNKYRSASYHQEENTSE